RTDTDFAAARDTFGRIHHALARALLRRDRPKDAEAAFEIAVSHLTKAGENPDVAPSAKGALQQCRSHFAGFLAQSGRVDAIEKGYLPEIEAQATASQRNLLAWRLVSHPDPRVHQGGAGVAVRLARGAVDLEPKNGPVVNTLGAAYYRAGDWKAAIATLEK